MTHQDEWSDRAERSEVLKKIRRIEIVTRRAAADTLAGQYHSVFKGRGIEFDQVRPYTVGDDIRSIDWNVTARHGSPFIKQYQEERELTVMLLVDLSASGLFGTRSSRKIELAAELSALLAFSAIQNNDKVGLLLFTDRVERVILPQKGRKHVLRVISEILSYTPQRRGTDINEALTYLSRLRLNGAIVFLISDFISPDYSQGLKVVSRKHDLVGLLVRDEKEAVLPDVGLAPLEDLESGETVWVDTSDRNTRRYHEEYWRKMDAERRMLLGRLKVEHVELSCGDDYVPRLAAFFRRRAGRR